MKEAMKQWTVKKEKKIHLIHFMSVIFLMLMNAIASPLRTIL